MNFRTIMYTVGKTVALEGAFLIIPMVISLIYHEPFSPFLIGALACELVGVGLRALGNKGSESLFTREGYAIVSLSWIALSALGALPFYISGSIPSYVDAFFESVSGFTTTGASILSDVTALG